VAASGEVSAIGGDLSGGISTPASEGALSDSDRGTRLAPQQPERYRNRFLATRRPQVRKRREAVSFTELWGITDVAAHVAWPGHAIEAVCGGIHVCTCVQAVQAWGRSSQLASRNCRNAGEEREQEQPGQHNSRTEAAVDLWCLGWC
jgi:hypothetical protein